MTIKAHRLIIATIALLALTPLHAEEGGSYSAYTPYSVFGAGQLFGGGSAYNMTMGGAGIASRNHRYINLLNPAAVTARDTLAFMSDFSVYENNKTLKQSGRSSANNIFNINDFVISFPLFYSNAADLSAMVGIKPYSSTGYSYGYYETDPSTLATLGNVAHAYTGQGSIYQVFGTVGAELFDKVSVGVEGIYYFGNIKRKYTQSIEDKAALALSKTTDMSLSAASAKFGLQYEQPIGDKLTIGVGAVYTLKSNLHGYIEASSVSGEYTDSHIDTIGVTTSPVYLAGEAGIGISLAYGNKFRASLDYTRADWGGSGFENVSGFAVDAVGGDFRSTVAQSIRAGVEYIPNPSDIRYYHKLIAYRAGVYYNKEYFSVAGHDIYSRGITLGATLPVFRWSNGLTLGMELGKRGSLKDNLIEETYVNFSLGINLFDIWFQQRRYE